MLLCCRASVAQASSLYLSASSARSLSVLPLNCAIGEDYDYAWRSKPSNAMKQINEKVVVFGSHDESTIDQICRCVATGSYGVLCADGHKGYSQPIGGVVAYKDRISISGVGYDIACGNMAIRTDANASQIQGALEGIMRDITARSRLELAESTQLQSITNCSRLAFGTRNRGRTGRRPRQTNLEPSDQVIIT